MLNHDILITGTIGTIIKKYNEFYFEELSIIIFFISKIFDTYTFENISKLMNFFIHNYLSSNLLGYYGIHHQKVIVEFIHV